MDLTNFDARRALPGTASSCSVAEVGDFMLIPSPKIR